MKYLIGFVALIIIAAGGFYFYQSKGTGAQVADLPTEASVYELLKTVTLDVTDFGGTTVTLVNGESEFAAGPATGFAKLADPRAIVFKGDDADVYALYYVNGGGTGTFAFLEQFEYSGATQTLTEVDRVLLGDRIEVNTILLNQTAPTSYDILVELKERKPFEGMAALPTIPLVYHYARTAEGMQIVNVVFGTVAAHDVVIQAPLPGSTTGKTFEVLGAARGPWFFEANIPVHVRDSAGNTVASVGGTAQGEWMTEDLVPFSAAIELPSDASGIYTVVVSKDNPSGEPENDASIEFPIVVN